MGRVFETYRFVVATLFGEIGYIDCHHTPLEVTIMTATETIRARRTIFKFKPGPVPNEDIEQILSYGIWAPNHHITEPVAIHRHRRRDQAETRRPVSSDQDGGYPRPR